MPYSMTGYGGAKADSPFGSISVEFKSVNHRYFEFSARVPRDTAWAEERLRALAQKKLARGKVECFLRLETQGTGSVRVQTDDALAREYLAAIAHLKALAPPNVQGDEGVQTLDYLKMPGVITLATPDADADALWAAIRPAAEEALDALGTMRAREGAALGADINAHLDSLAAHTDAVAALSPQTAQAYRERLETRIRALLDDRQIDETRLLTETAIFADKIAVDEETARLKGHIAQMRAYLAQSATPIGRKLDFLTQEMNREANTTGSKALDAAVTAHVLEMKSEIEKIREQVQNIE
ncbi:MAG: YicC family protein [Oscillospiraceae bacterium]|jgi:uncharacterized protein (TIGR00255 family)|nr:YicC family protein [Oscillospiraceae bacterium]